MKRTLIQASLVIITMAGSMQARDFGVLLLPVHQGKFTSTLLYEGMKLTDDFDSRGRVDFRSQVVGASFSYGITDQVAVAVKGGSLVNASAEAQSSAWKSRGGYVYGLDLYNEVFPATPGWRPGVNISGGVTGFHVPFDRVVTGGVVTRIDQSQYGFEYHGSVVATYKIGITEPYAGLRAFGSSVTWKDNSPSAGSARDIQGHAHGNISIVAGLPVQVTKDIQIFVEGRVVSESVITTGITVATF